MSHFAVLVTKTQKSSVESQLERFYEQGDESDYFMEHQVEVAAGDVEGEARRLLVKRIERDGVDDGLTVKYQQYINEGEFRQVVEDWHGGNWDENGNLYFLDNPDAQWDWFVIGGRWTGGLALKDGAEGELGKPGVFNNQAKPNTADIAKVKDVDWKKTSPTFAILHNDEWIEQGQMGWFGMAANEKPEDEWASEFRRIVESLDPEDEVTIVDCHI